MTAAQWFMLGGALATLFGIGLGWLGISDMRAERRKPAPPAVEVARPYRPGRVTPHRLDRTRIMPRVDPSTRPHGRTAR